MGSLCPTLQKGQLRRAGARPRGRCRAARQAGPLEMPGGCLWLDSHAHNYSILYGQQFVIQRPPRGGEGLVLAPQITQLQMVQEGQTTDRRVWEDDCLELDEADFWEAQPVRLLPGDCTEPSTSLGIIPHPTASGAPEPEQALSSNPRRTRRLQFTCQRCGTTTTRPVNPRAWAAGTIFAQCSGCQVIHKVADHLQLVHELVGPVFPPRVPEGFVMPKGLPAKPTLTHHTHPAAWLPEDLE